MELWTSQLSQRSPEILLRSPLSSYIIPSHARTTTMEKRCHGLFSQQFCPHKDPRGSMAKERWLRAPSFEGRLHATSRWVTADSTMRLLIIPGVYHENIDTTYPHEVVLRIKHMYRYVLCLTYNKHSINFKNFIIYKSKKIKSDNPQIQKPEDG